MKRLFKHTTLNIQHKYKHKVLILKLSFCLNMPDMIYLLKKSHGIFFYVCNRFLVNWCEMLARWFNHLVLHRDVLEVTLRILFLLDTKRYFLTYSFLFTLCFLYWMANKRYAILELHRRGNCVYEIARFFQVPHPTIS